MILLLLLALLGASATVSAEETEAAPEAVVEPAVVELAPAKLRTTFTVRELARLSDRVTDADAHRIADTAGTQPSERLRALLIHMGTVRGEVEPLAEPGEDDVVDPYRRPWEVYEQMASELMPALGEVVRLLDVATAPPTR